MCVPSLSRFVIASCRGLFQVIAKGTIGQCSSSPSSPSSCFLPLPLLPASSFSRHGPLIVCSTLPPFESFHSILPSVSTNKTIPNKCLFHSVLHIGLGLDSPDVPSSCSGVWDQWSIEYQSSIFCDACVVLMQKQTGFVPTSAQFSR